MAPLEANCQTPTQRRVTRWASTWPEQLDSDAQVRPDDTPELAKHFAPVGTRGISLDGFYSERKVQSCPIANLANAEEGEEMPRVEEPNDSTWSEQSRIEAAEQQFGAQEAEEHFAPVGTRGISLDGFYSERKVQSWPIASFFGAADNWSEGDAEEEEDDEEEERKKTAEAKEAACHAGDGHTATNVESGKVQSPPAPTAPEKNVSAGLLTSLPLYHISQVASETPGETSCSRSCSVDSAKPASSTSAGSRGTRSATTPRCGSKGATFLTAEQFVTLKSSQEDLVRQNAELLARIEQLEAAAQKSANPMRASEKECKAAAEYFDISDDAEQDDASAPNISAELIFSTDSDVAFNTSQGQSALPPDMLPFVAPSSCPLSQVQLPSVPGRPNVMPEHTCSTAAGTPSQAWHQHALTSRIPPPPAAAPVLSASVLSQVEEKPPPMTAQGPQAISVPEDRFIMPKIHTQEFGLPAHTHPSIHPAGMPECLPQAPAPMQTFPPAAALAYFEPPSRPALMPTPASVMASHPPPTVVMPPSSSAATVLPPRVPAPPCLALAAQLPDPRLEVAAQCPSVGSADHFRGRCKPCAFFHSRGCESGANCKYCHICPPGEKKRRQRDLCEAGKARSHLWRMAVAEAYAAEAARQAAACKDEYPQAFRR